MTGRPSCIYSACMLAELPLFSAGIRRCAVQHVWQESGESVDFHPISMKQHMVFGQKSKYLGSRNANHCFRHQN